jgi:hypothetical protein
MTEQEQQTMRSLAANLSDLMRAVQDFLHAKKYATLPEQYAEERKLEATFKRINKFRA